MGDSKLTPDLADTEAAGSAERPTASDAEWRAGVRLADRYVLRRFLGSGGMGQVWVAFDEVLDKEVALKRVRADVVVAGEALESLRREVSLAQTVTHVNVCRIYDLEPIGSDWVIKMELIAGRTLAERLRETPQLPIDEALSLTRQLARGLAAVHAVGIVHRDLKPPNVLVDDEGRAVLMDFGIARAAAPTGDTEPAQIVGTPEYMAPEQARGERVDARTDLYALGCVLYRALAGEVPFPATTRVAAMARHLVDAPPDARRKRPDTPPWLAELVRRLMAKSPAQRPPSANAVAAQLHEPPSPWRRIALSAAALLLALVAGGGAWLAWRAHVRDAWRPQLGELPRDLDADSMHFYAAPDGRTLAFDGVRDGVWRVFTTNIEGGGPKPVGPAGQQLRGFGADGKSLLVSDEHSRLSRLALDDGALTSIALGVGGAVDCGRFGVVAVEKSPRCDLCADLARHRPDGTRDVLVALDEGVSIRPLMAGDPVRGRVAYATLGSPGHHQLYILPLDPVRVLPPVAVPVAPEIAVPGMFTDRDTLVVTLAQLGHDGGDLWELTLDGKKRRQLTFGGHAALPGRGARGELLFENLDTGSAAFVHDYANGRDRRLTFGQEQIYGVLPTPDDTGLVLATWRGQFAIVHVPLDGGAERILVAHTDAKATLDERFVGGRFYYQLAADQRGGPLWSRALDEPESRLEMKWLPGTLSWVRDGYVHYYALPTPNTIHAERMRLADPHDVALDIPPPWEVVLDAPTGGWRVASRATQPSIGLWPPGAPLTGEPMRQLHGSTFTWSADGRFLVYRNGNRLLRHEVATGRERVALATPNVIDFIESRDGSALYTILALRHASRQAIVNFADRPPL